MRRFLIRLILQVAQNQRRAVFLRQMEQFLVENRPQPPKFDFRIADEVRGHGQSLSFELSSLGGALPRMNRHSVSRAIQPVGQQFRSTQSLGFLDHYEKGSLKRVFGIVIVMQYAPADTQDHQPMPPQECRERRFLMPLRKPLQKFSIGQLVEHLRIDALDAGSFPIDRRFVDPDTNCSGVHCLSSSILPLPMPINEKCLPTQAAKKAGVLLSESVNNRGQLIQVVVGQSV
jgi:hypothetical protein